MNPSETALPTAQTLYPVVQMPSGETIIAVIITIVFIWWLIFTVVAVYHWFRYARDSWLTVPSLAIHLFVSGWLFIFTIGGMQ